MFAQVLVTGSRALVLQQWNWRENKSVRTWRAVHVAPVAGMAFDSSSTLLATGETLCHCHLVGMILRGPSAFEEFNSAGHINYSIKLKWNGSIKFGVI